MFMSVQSQDWVELTAEELLSEGKETDTSGFPRSAEQEKTELRFQV